jgi:hypothetical protein
MQAERIDLNDNGFVRLKHSKLSEKKLSKNGILMYSRLTDFIFD